MKFIVFSTSLLFSTMAMAADDYVAVDPSSIETISSTILLSVSYAIIVGLLIVYWGYMAYQTHKIRHRISTLEREVEL
ncbi:MAG: hypothetical protein JXX14_25610 [Deltaproteobacteria bacterium]|nr:hypothetical protein [Deltaproteobacteria bacterium]